MMYRGCATAILLLAWTAFCGPVFSVGANVGGTESMVEADKTPKGINVTGTNWVGYFMFGLGGDVNFNEYIGAGLGLNYEKRGGIESGTWSVGGVNLLSGQYEFDYRYLQVPVFVKGMLPLMIPGSVYVTLGPEFGFVMQSQRTWMPSNSSTSQTDNIDTLTNSMDFGLSATLGYDLPIAWFGSLRVWGGYYHGFVDIYNDKTMVNGNSLDYDIFNRAFKYGLSFYVNINSPRRR